MSFMVCLNSKSNEKIQEPKSLFVIFLFLYCLNNLRTDTLATFIEHVKNNQRFPIRFL